MAFAKRFCGVHLGQTSQFYRRPSFRFDARKNLAFVPHSLFLSLVSMMSLGTWALLVQAAVKLAATKLRPCLVVEMS